MPSLHSGGVKQDSFPELESSRVRARMEVSDAKYLMTTGPGSEESFHLVGLACYSSLRRSLVALSLKKKSQSGRPGPPLIILRLITLNYALFTLLVES